MMIRTEKQLYFSCDIVKGYLYLHITKEEFQCQISNCRSEKNRRTLFKKHKFHEQGLFDKQIHQQNQEHINQLQDLIEVLGMFQNISLAKQLQMVQKKELKFLLQNLKLVNLKLHTLKQSLIVTLSQPDNCQTLTQPEKLQSQDFQALTVKLNPDNLFIQYNPNLSDGKSNAILIYHKVEKNYFKQLINLL